MSFILDALRKSEHERQINAGNNTGLLYQVEIKSNHYPWLIPAAIVVVALILIVLVWRIWLQPDQTYTAPPNNIHETNSGSQAPSSDLHKNSATQSPNEKHSVISKKKTSPPTHVDASASPSANLENIPKHGSGDPLKDLPPLNISGYVHNEQSGTVAMINNQLVHEGEEVSPGLRLIKILDNSAIFSYKGYVFTR
jgi:general secretion pathway protein B